jgi:hypothetical protein
MDKEEKDNFKYRTSRSHKLRNRIFTRGNSGQDNQAQCFDYNKEATQENHLGRQEEIYTTSVREGFVGAGALEEGAEA